MGSIPWTTVIVVVLVAVVLTLTLPSDQPFLESNLKDLAANLTIVITGANSGLGYATVEHLAKLGSSKTLVLACRSIAKCKDARDKAASFLPDGSTTQLVTAILDLGSRSSIERFSADVLELVVSTTSQQQEHNERTLRTDPVIDVLINNAGIFARNLEPNYLSNGIEEHIYVNYLGHVLLTHLLWPTLQRCGARVVSVSSISAIFPTNPLVGWYAWDQQWSHRSSSTSGLMSYFRSKRANLMFAHQLHHHHHQQQQQLAASTLPMNTPGVSSVASHPGFSRSEIWLNGGKCLPSWLSKYVFTNPRFSMTSSQGALSQLWAALDRTQVPSGTYVGPRWWLYGNPILLGSIQQPVVPLHQYPFADDNKLWETTMQGLGIQTFGHPVASSSSNSSESI